VSTDRSIAGIVLRDGKVFTALRPPGGAQGGRWEFPGGKVEEGESDREALEREFMEEFGAAVCGLRLLGEESFTHRGKERVLAAWLIELLPGATLVPREHGELRWASYDELLGLNLADSDRKLLPFIKDLAK
jgi:8-oxo-dGTP diphosphatase